MSEDFRAKCPTCGALVRTQGRGGVQVFVCISPTCNWSSDGKGK